MAVLAVTTAQMGGSCFEINGILAMNSSQNLSFSCGFPISRKPIFGVTLKTKKAKQGRIFGLRTCRYGVANVSSKLESDNRLPDCGLLEKEFEFRPSFDDYLQAMESVRSGKEKKQPLHSNRYKSMNDFRGKGPPRKPQLEGDEGNVKLGDFDSQSHGEKSELLKQDESCKNSKGTTCLEGPASCKIDCKESGSGKLKDAGKTALKEEGNGGSAHGLVRDKESETDLNFKRSLEVNITNGRWTKNKRDDQLKQRNFGTSKHGFRTNEMRGRLAKDFVKGEKDSDKGIASKIVKLRSSTALILKKNNDKEVEMERAAFKSLEVFNDVLDKPRVSRLEMEERIQKLAQCLNGVDINMPEWKFSKMMRSAKIRFSDYSILRLIQILGKLGNWRRALQVIEWIQLRERFKSHKIRHIYTAALDVLGKARRPVEALNLFNAMQQHMSSYPDLVAYHCIAVTLGQAGHLKELFDVIDCIRCPPKKKFKTGVLEKWDPRLEPDIVVYNAVLNACVRRKQWEGAFWVLQQLNQHGQRPSSTTYGLVMEVMFACGKYNLVHEFFQKVQKSSIPNAATYKVLVNTLWREGKTDEAISAIQEMEKRGIVGSAGLYYDLARCLCSAGRCQEALMQIDKICKVANKPLVVTYTGLIQACLEGGNVENGAYIFNHMYDFCHPNLVTCNIMLKAYLEHGMFEEAKKLFQKMSEDGSHIRSEADYKDRVIADIYTFNTMLNACVAEQRWDDLEYVYKQMLHHGFHFNAKRHLRMILDACRAGKGGLLETTWKHLVQTKRDPPSLLVKEMFRMKLEQDDYAAALSCIVSHHPSELQVFSHKAWLNFFKKNGDHFQKDTLISLIHESSMLVPKSDSQNPILQNLIACCREFLRTHITAARDSPNRNLLVDQSETALKF
ncbi:hypothetical protein F0562_029561 [Nyssa sinensis]|uniref:Pentacotripeptide-repeat region of PRORP domain-containing protein n=1 Tax=Nyssa sinensis TaxID=561372 RepID=A0A5J5B1F9_9ASTE|nr:hypothetical protein F0562_029561 [Nyssa sinensis]